MQMDYVEEQWRDVTMGKHRGDWRFIARHMSEVAEEAYKRGLSTADEELDAMRLALSKAKETLRGMSITLTEQALNATKAEATPPPQTDGSCSQ
jgi:hypothetical protein